MVDSLYQHEAEHTSIWVYLTHAFQKLDPAQFGPFEKAGPVIKTSSIQLGLIGPLQLLT
jgi:hypothetical protein